MMSFVKVMNGPVARAGSIFSLLSKSGNAVPNREAKRMTLKRETVTVMGIAKESMSKNRVKTKMIEEQMVALMRAPPISLVMFWIIFFALSELEANPFTTIAEDWIPTFPPIAVITGMNIAVAGKSAMSAS